MQLDNIIFVAFIFLSVWMTTIILAKMVYKNSISLWRFLIMAIGYTGIITRVIGIW